jgi:lysophospholipase L1-like esterase
VSLKSLAAVLSLASIATLAPSPEITRAAQAGADHQEFWVGTWACSPQLSDSSVSPPTPDLSDTTLRQIVHVSVGGTTIRVRFSNEFGKSPLSIAAAHIAKAGGADAIEPGTDKPLAFGGQPSVTIPAGALMYSDSVAFDLPPLSDLVATIFVKSVPDGVTTHAGSRATSYLTHGDFVSETTLPSPQSIDHWYFLTGVDVVGRKSSNSVAILGDSITDGRNSNTNGNGRWPDDLARRLQSNKHTKNIGVLNGGIGGNRLLHDGLGPNALSRLDRDVLAQSGVRWLVILEGVNDIGTCKNDCNLDELARDIIRAYQQIIVRAHAHHIRVYGATILPFGGSHYAAPDAERARQSVNQWIRSSGSFDAVIDLDAATRDPRNPANLSSKADSGDHLHPNDSGYRLVADAVNLRLFTK